MRLVYGPVPSFRLGRSLGVDLLCAAEKTCPFDCIYCQLGKTIHKTRERGEFVDISTLEGDLNTALDRTEADIVTLSGTGEPTLALNLGRAVEVIRDLTDLPIAVLTNSALMGDAGVRDELAAADRVIAKLDAPDERRFRMINRPHRDVRFGDVLNGIKTFGRDFEDKLTLQMMFVERNRTASGEMALLAGEIGPVEVQLDTPLRKSPVRPLSREEMEEIEQDFQGFNVVNVYKREKPGVRVIDRDEILKRRRTI